MKNYKIRTAAENNNFVELDLELQEFRFLALTENGSQASVGGVNSNFSISQLGRTALRSLVF